MAKMKSAGVGNVLLDEKAIKLPAQKNKKNIVEIIIKIICRPLGEKVIPRLTRGRPIKNIAAIPMPESWALPVLIKAINTNMASAL